MKLIKLDNHGDADLQFRSFEFETGREKKLGHCNLAITLFLG